MAPFPKAAHPPHGRAVAEEAKNVAKKLGAARRAGGPSEGARAACLNGNPLGQGLPAQALDPAASFTAWESLAGCSASTVRRWPC